MKPHIMVDLETLGTSPGSVILSIGAVKFDAYSVTESFYRVIKPQSCIDVGMSIDPATVLWWMQQDNGARQALTEKQQEAVPLSTMLHDFRRWVGDEGAVVWGNGASFDNALLSEAYRLAKIEQPWKFWDDRCYRTLKNLCLDAPFERVGTYHNAVDDALSQANHLIAIAKIMQLESFFV